MRFSTVTPKPTVGNVCPRALRAVSSALIPAVTLKRLPPRISLKSSGRGDSMETKRVSMPLSRIRSIRSGENMLPLVMVEILMPRCRAMRAISK